MSFICNKIRIFLKMKKSFNIIENLSKPYIYIYNHILFTI